MAELASKFNVGCVIQYCVQISDPHLKLCTDSCHNIYTIPLLQRTVFCSLHSFIIQSPDCNIEVHCVSIRPDVNLVYVADLPSVQ